MRVLTYTLLVAALALSPMEIIAQENAKPSVKNADMTVQMTSQQELIDLFITAAKTGNQEVIGEFLKHGFPVDVRNSAGYTALMMAAYYGHQNIVTTLIKYGADACARDLKGNTAIMGAMFKLEWSIVKQLRQVDCDTNANVTGQKTLTEFAKIIGQDAKLKALTE